MEDLGQKLRQYIKTGTPAERRIAKYFSEHLNELPFETASSVADRLELSPMTVGRFLRSLGYQGLDGIKVHLRENVTPVTLQLPNVLEQLQKDANEGRPIAGQIAEQVEMLQHIYNLTSQPHWLDAVATILSSSEVFVTAHLSLASLGRHLCDRLAFARDHVQFLDGSNGSYIELLGHQSNDALVVIVDSPRFVASRLLARSARRSGYKVLLITSQYTEWAHEFANMTLSLPPLRAGNHENLSAMMALLEFLAVAVIHAAGEEAESRIHRIEELEGMFAHAPLR
ncbi:MurR/RpiR family transcriptional regulator [Rhizobium sp. CB3171]|uniref:MurR/RpiR family transcriptional regulator n=1 Tax=unclassified Rhizobium TaxID=2613769 RepID=UPI000CDF3CF9|nr:MULTISPECIES: MurR/RpiR family transcriptional regulator [Rhizobium]AVA23012.1 RpiR family transcriptional regulator protein [Rhizobium sp. NXC24]MDK4741890.1 MurR/RpiR family transcriptional regulator [Rhizobium sp. CNPSo 3464]UWU20376.1 MurR/RpiR family transcriptional regulator [Rhizobium tropici]WFU01197.1 MurR/RpiR family transcriptional regulator [Rhizobium sp. CB3171]